jgi:hypothetical protein
VFKAYLNSWDRGSGSVTSAGFFVELPNEFHSKNVLISVDSFVYDDGVATETKVTPTYIEIPELRSPLSWYSGTCNPTGILQLISTTSFQSSGNSPQGVYANSSLFKNPITIEFIVPPETEQWITDNWSLVLSIYDAGDLL